VVAHIYSRQTTTNKTKIKFNSHATCWIWFAIVRQRGFHNLIESHVTHSAGQLNTMNHGDKIKVTIDQQGKIKNNLE